MSDLQSPEPQQITQDQDLALRQYAPILAFMGTECSMFWSRSQLFLVANSALIGFAAKDITTVDPKTDPTKVWIYLVLSFFGILLCTLWHIAITLGSQWMEWWTSKLKELEPCAFGNIELWRQRPPTGWVKVRYVARGTAILFTILWAALFLYLLTLALDQA
jgi:hypothetical protein